MGAGSQSASRWELRTQWVSGVSVPCPAVSLTGRESQALDRVSLSAFPGQSGSGRRTIVLQAVHRSPPPRETRAFTRCSAFLIKTKGPHGGRAETSSRGSSDVKTATFTQLARSQALRPPSRTQTCRSAHSMSPGLHEKQRQHPEV